MTAGDGLRVYNHFNMKTFMIIATIFLPVVFSQAQIRHVPSQYPTIQAGINASNQGDTVLVDEGIYYEKIDLTGHKPFLIGSRFILDGNESHIHNTIIDGSHLQQSEQMSVVTFGSGNDSTTILSGFKIQGGQGTHFTGPFGDILVGGGIFVSGGGAKICHNIIFGNEIDDGIYSGTQYFVGGGGIFTNYEAPGYWTVIENNTITNNSVTGHRQCAYGGGIYLCNNTRIINNQILFNQCWALGTANDMEGGGLGAQSAQTPKKLFLEGNQIENNLVAVVTDKMSFGAGIALFDMEAIITDNQIRYNKAAFPIPPFRLFGGGIDFEGISPGSLIKGNLFEGNEATQNGPGNGYGSWGGAIRLANLITDTLHMEISNNKFINNKADWGGAIQSYGIHLHLFNNIFIRNQASYTGGAVHVNWDSTAAADHYVIFANNSFYKNWGYTGGAISSWNANPVIFNCIFSKDSSDCGSNELLVGNNGGNLEIAYSCFDTLKFTTAIDGNVIRGNNIICTDPLFRDTITLVTEHWSPCVDNGIMSFTCIHQEVFDAPLFDLLENSRPVGLGYDQGAYDLEAGGVGIYRDTIYDLRFTINPNPVKASTTFYYEMKEAGHVTLEIFDGFGRKVAEPVNGYHTQGKHEFSWNASGFRSGIYYFHFEASDKISSGKIVIVR